MGCVSLSVPQNGNLNTEITCHGQPWRPRNTAAAGPYLGSVPCTSDEYIHSDEGVELISPPIYEKGGWVLRRSVLYPLDKAATAAVVRCSVVHIKNALNQLLRENVHCIPIPRGVFVVVDPLSRDRLRMYIILLMHIIDYDIICLPSRMYRVASLIFESSTLCFYRYCCLHNVSHILRFHNDIYGFPNTMACSPCTLIYLYRRGGGQQYVKFRRLAGCS